MAEKDKLFFTFSRGAENFNNSLIKIMLWERKRSAKKGSQNMRKKTIHLGVTGFEVDLSKR